MRGGRDTRLTDLAQADFDEDDSGEVEANVAESSRKALVEVLGQERRDRILAALYIVRQDSVLVVRTSSIQIWKALVHNTPRTGTSARLMIVQGFNMSQFASSCRSLSPNSSCSSQAPNSISRM